MSELPELSPTLDRLRAHVLEHSVKTGDFVLKSGARSSWFLDTKQTACRADGIIAVADAIVEVFGDDLQSIDAIGGLTLGADPMAYGVAAVLGTRGIDLRSFSVRKEAKQGGVTGRIAGALQPGDRVLVTEDVTDAWHVADRSRRPDRGVRGRTRLHERDRRPGWHVRRHG